jgi:hypothetical protein
MKSTQKPDEPYFPGVWVRRRCTTVVQAAQPKSLSTSPHKHLGALEQTGGGGIRTPGQPFLQVLARQGITA